MISEAGRGVHKCKRKEIETVGRVVCVCVYVCVSACMCVCAVCVCACECVRVCEAAADIGIVTIEPVHGR